MPPRKRLGQLLTELGVIDEHQLQSALGHQKQWGGKLGSVLVQKGFCKEPDVVSALSKHLGMPQVKLADAKVDPRAVKFVSRQIAEKLHVFPYELSGSGRGEVVTVAMSDPTDLSAVDQLAFHTGKRIKPMLAGDTEIVQMIQTHYGDEKRATTGELKPVMTPVAGVPAVKPVATPAAVAPGGAPNQFPRRIGPETTPAGGSPRVAPYIPPPVPAAAQPLESALEEIEPDESMSVPAAAPEAVELPEDDGQMALEPIAAHSQLGDEVAGQEEFAGEGSTADAVEGLESASVKHEGLDEAQMEGLEPIAAHSQEPAPEGGWGAPAEAPAPEGWGAEAASGWEQAAETPAPEAPVWADETPVPAAETPAAWSAGEGWDAQAADASGEQLPVDAILGTAEQQQQATPWGAEETPPTADEAPASTEEFAAPATEEPSIFAEEPPAAAVEPEEAAAPAESAEAPDAWASTEDPLAATTETPPPTWGEMAPPEEEPAVEEVPPEARPITDKFAQEAAAQTVTAETEAPPEWGEAEAPAAAEESAPPEEAAAEESAAPAEEAYAATEEPAAPAEENEPPAEETYAAAEEPVAPADEPAAPAEEEPAPPAEEPPALYEEMAAAQEEPAPAEESMPAEEPAPEEPAAAEETAAAEERAAAEEPPPSDEFNEEQGELKLEGWIAPPPEPEPQGAGWFGQALAETTPLSAADVGTLASVGIDPNDGVAALRLLVAMVRVLSRRQSLELDEIVAEVNESRTQAAAEHAVAQQEASETEQAGQPEAEPAET